MFRPIRKWETSLNEHGDAKCVIEISPDAFRMCWCLYLVCFFALATFITTKFAATDFEDNPILNRFGTNSICVMLDDPPFSLFGWTLWFPATMLALAFEFFDYIRVHDHYHDEDAQYPITKGFFTYYSISTAVESLSTVVFAQVFATSPTEYMYMHTWPYFAWSLPCLWSIILKRFLYNWKLHVLPLYVFVWVGICGIVVIIFFDYIYSQFAWR